MLTGTHVDAIPLFVAQCGLTARLVVRTREAIEFSVSRRQGWVSAATQRWFPTAYLPVSGQPSGGATSTPPTALKACRLATVMGGHATGGSKMRLSRTLRLLLGVVAAAVLFVGTAGVAPRRVEGALDAQACIDALRGDRGAALALIAAQTKNFNRWTIGSVLDKANAAAQKARNDQRDALYKAYQYAYRGSKATADQWITKANAAFDRATAAFKKYNAEIAVINKATAKINADRHLLFDGMDATDLTCSGF